MTAEGIRTHFVAQLPQWSTLPSVLVSQPLATSESQSAKPAAQAMDANFQRAFGSAEIYGKLPVRCVCLVGKQEWFEAIELSDGFRIS